VIIMPKEPSAKEVGEAFIRSMGAGMGSSDGGFSVGLPLRPGTTVRAMPKMRMGNDVSESVDHALGRRPATTQTQTETEMVEPSDAERKLEAARLEALKDDIEYWKKTKGIVTEPKVDPAVSAAAKLAEARKLVLDAAVQEQAETHDRHGVPLHVLEDACAALAFELDRDLQPEEVARVCANTLLAAVHDREQRQAEEATTGGARG
jgi:hypothetical protein